MAAPLRRLLSGEDSEEGSEVSAEGGEGDSETESYIVPELSHFECTGPFLAGECPEGKVPFISAHAMEQASRRCHRRTPFPLSSRCLCRLLRLVAAACGKFQLNTPVQYTINYCST